MSDVSLQDIGSGGWGSVSESFGGNGDTGSGSIWSSLAPSLINDAANIGLASLGNSPGITSSPYGYLSPGSGGGSAYRGRPAVAAGIGGNSLLLVGLLLVGGFFLVREFRKKE